MAMGEAMSEWAQANSSSLDLACFVLSKHGPQAPSVDGEGKHVTRPLPMPSFLAALCHSRCLKAWALVRDCSRQAWRSLCPCGDRRTLAGFFIFFL